MMVKFLMSGFLLIVAGNLFPAYEPLSLKDSCLKALIKNPNQKILSLPLEVQESLLEKLVGSRTVPGKIINFFFSEGTLQANYSQSSIYDLENNSTKKRCYLGDFPITDKVSLKIHNPHSRSFYFQKFSLINTVNNETTMCFSLSSNPGNEYFVTFNESMSPNNRFLTFSILSRFKHILEGKQSRSSSNMYTCIVDCVNQNALFIDHDQAFAPDRLTNQCFAGNKYFIYSHGFYNKKAYCQKVFIVNLISGKKQTIEMPYQYNFLAGDDYHKCKHELVQLAGCSNYFAIQDNNYGKTYVNTLPRLKNKTLHNAYFDKIAFTADGSWFIGLSVNQTGKNCSLNFIDPDNLTTMKTTDLTFEKAPCHLHCSADATRVLIADENSIQQISRPDLTRQQKLCLWAGTKLVAQKNTNSAKELLENNKMDIALPQKTNTYIENLINNPDELTTDYPENKFTAMCLNREFQKFQHDQKNPNNKFIESDFLFEKKINKEHLKSYIAQESNYRLLIPVPRKNQSKKIVGYYDVEKKRGLIELLKRNKKVTIYQDCKDPLLDLSNLFSL